MWVHACGCAGVCRRGEDGEARGMEMGERVPSGQEQTVPAGLWNQTCKGTHWKLPTLPHPTASANAALTQSHEEKKVSWLDHCAVHLTLI